MGHRCRECGQEMRQAGGRYHWVESGLDNVYIEGDQVKQWECPNGHKTVQIGGLKNLLDTLAETLANKRGRLTGPEVRYLRKSLYWKAGNMARALGVDAATLSRIENGHAPVSGAVDRMVRMIYQNPSEAERNLMALTDEPGENEEFLITATAAGIVVTTKPPIVRQEA